MKTKYLFLILVLPLFSAQCKKEEATKQLVTVGGYAYDLATKDSIADVKIRLRRDDVSLPGSGNSLNSFETIFDSTTTNKDGYFEFTFFAENAAFCYEPIKAGYWYYPGMDVTVFGGDQSNNLGLNLYPLTYLKVHIVYEAPAMINDSIWYDGPTDRSTEYTGNFYYPSIYSHDFGRKGSQVDTTFVVTIKYNEVPLQYWDVTTSGQTIRSLAYVGCNPHETCLVEIKY